MGALPADLRRVLQQVMEALNPSWQPGEPLYDTELPCHVPPVLSAACPPDCWCHTRTGCHTRTVGGYAFRWTADLPVLRFLRDGLHVTGGMSYESIEVPF